MSVEEEKALDKVQHWFMIQSLRRLGLIGNFLNLQSVSTELLNQQKTELFLLNIGKKDAFSYHFYSTLCLKSWPIHWSKWTEIKRTQSFKERIKIFSAQRHGIRKYLENPKSAIKKQAVKSDTRLAGCRRQC